jgi:hypothetical protein
MVVEAYYNVDVSEVTVTSVFWIHAAGSSQITGYFSTRLHGVI